MLQSIQDAPTPNPNAKPAIGEQTKRQNWYGAALNGMSMWPACHPNGIDRTDRDDQQFGLFPFWYSCLGAFYPVYRLMRKQPTIALVRSIVTGPIIASTWEIESEDDATEEEIAWVKDNFEKRRKQIVRDAIRCVDYGWQPFEIAWALKPGISGGPVRYQIEKFKPLLPDATYILQDKFGNFAGLKNQQTPLDPVNCWAPSHDAEAGNPYGRSRFENIREHAWLPWLSAARKSEVLDGRVGEIIPIVYVPPGSFIDEHGVAKTYVEVAQAILPLLVKGNGIVLESTAYSDEDVRQNPDKGDKSLCRIDTIDFGNRGPSQMAMLAKMGYFDGLFFRGMLRSERVGMATEGGTKADAKVHSDSGVHDSEDIDDDICAELNDGPIATGQRLNFGENRVGKVRLSPAPLVDYKRETYRAIIDQLCKDSNFAASLAKTVDMDEVLERMEIPVLHDFIFEVIQNTTPVDKNGNPVATPAAKKTDHAQTTAPPK